MLPFVFMLSVLYGAGNWSSIPGRGRDFFLTRPFPIRLRGPPTFLLNVQGAHFLWGVRRPGHPLKRWDSVWNRSRFCVPDPVRFTVHQWYHSIPYRRSTDRVLHQRKYQTHLSTPPLSEIRFWRLWRFAPTRFRSTWVHFCCELVLATSCFMSNCWSYSSDSKQSVALSVDTVVWATDCVHKLKKNNRNRGLIPFFPFKQ